MAPVRRRCGGGGGGCCGGGGGGGGGGEYAIDGCRVGSRSDADYGRRPATVAARQPACGTVPTRHVTWGRPSTAHQLYSRSCDPGPAGSCGTMPLSCRDLSDRFTGDWRACHATPRPDTPSQVTLSQTTPRKPRYVEPSHAKPNQATLSQATPSQATPRHAKPSQAKPSQAKPSQTKPNQAKPSHATPSHVTPRHVTSRAHHGHAGL